MNATPVIDTTSTYRRQLSGEFGHDELTGTGYVIADKIELWLKGHPGLHTPSRIATAIKHPTQQVRDVLSWMDKHVYVAARGNGTLRRYSAR